ncbi:hypothetical protein M3647_05500 [Paenibacillus cellulositrophicus]|uniref:hypothetical protein n=1 Tax=Paenibacillus cellulositrophicus TaxID=562959 RepID=UPI0020416927|nr:hypothetical protein [Paenibacillus cellulositrophicus]MCM2996920.1 hypothetical protein [Paenibacillus cellulositrophicus]
MAAAKLGRTIAACSFRWNSTLKKKYENSISKFNTKKITKDKAIPTTFIVNEPSTQELTNNNLIKELSEYINDVSDYINELEEKIKHQQKEIEKLSEQSKINRDRLIASDDLQKIISIISNAMQKGYLGRAN